MEGGNPARWLPAWLPLVTTNDGLDGVFRLLGMNSNKTPLDAGTFIASAVVANSFYPTGSPAAFHDPAGGKLNSGII